MRALILMPAALKEPALSALVSDYLKRTRPFLPVEFVSVKAEKVAGSHAQVERALAAEAERMAKLTPPQSWRVALDAQGSARSSENFADWLQRHRERAHPALCFYVGSACGLHRPFVSDCHERLSLSSFTLPHQLAALLLVEQIYRACTINAGAPYHKS